MKVVLIIVGVVVVLVCGVIFEIMLERFDEWEDHE